MIISEKIKVIPLGQYFVVCIGHSSSSIQPKMNSHFDNCMFWTARL